MREALRVALVLVAAVLGGCQAASPPLTQTQMDALQVRLVEAAPDRAFAAASSALLDAGYQIQVSDADAGVMTGEKREDPALAANLTVMVLTALGGATTDIPPSYHAVAIQILPVSQNRANVRIRPFLNGTACACTEHDKAGREVVEQLWTLMQRQVLMKEPSR